MPEDAETRMTTWKMSSLHYSICGKENPSLWRLTILGVCCHLKSVSLSVPWPDPRPIQSVEDLILQVAIYSDTVFII